MNTNKLKDLDGAVSEYYRHYYEDELRLEDVNERIAMRHALVIERSNVDLCKSRLNKFAAKSILDVGCGTGGATVLLAQAFDATVTGIDAYAPSIEIAKLRLECAQEPVGRCAFAEMSADRLLFPDESFDLVVSYQVMEHVRDPLSVLKEIHRVIAKEGIVHLTAPSYSSYYEPHYKIRWLPFQGPARARLWLWILGRPTDFVKHINFLTYKALIKNAKWAGFEVQHITKREVDVRVDQAIDSGRWQLVSMIFGRRFVKWMYLNFKVCDHEYVLRPVK